MQKSHKPSTQLAVAASPFAPARLHAQRAFEHGMALANEAILCGFELIRLREDNGETRGRKGNKSHGETISFEDRIEQEVGISKATAFRWMQAARAQLPALAGRLGVQAALNDSDAETITEIFEIEDVGPERIAEEVARLSEGKTLEQLLLPLDGTGAFDPSKLTGKARDAWEKIVMLCEPYDDDHLAPKLFEQEEYDAMHEDALVMRQRVEAGEIPPTRAWAGLRGRAAADGAGGRSVCNHYANLKTGLTKLRTSFAHWDELPGEGRTQLEADWQKLWSSVPGSIKATIKKAEGWK